jgi:hypothetical protein
MIIDFKYISITESENYLFCYKNNKEVEVVAKINCNMRATITNCDCIKESGNYFIVMINGSYGLVSKPDLFA